MAAAALAACDPFGGSGGGGPERGDVLADGLVVFPGAQLVREQWRGEDRSKGVDGNDLSRNARLDRSFRLSKSVARDEVLDFYEDSLGKAGWELRDRESGYLFIAKQVGDRTHTLSIETATGPTPLSEFDLVYTIGFRDD